MTTASIDKTIRGRLVPPSTTKNGKAYDCPLRTFSMAYCVFAILEQYDIYYKALHIT